MPSPPLSTLARAEDGVIGQARCGMGLSRWPNAGSSTSITSVPGGVLLVDDDPRFRVLARRVLEGSGLVVAGEAGDGRAALAAVAALRPAGVLLDIGLPDLDGFEVARRIAAERDAPHVLLVSATAGPVPDRALAACGAVGFVAKADLASADLRAYLEG